MRRGAATAIATLTLSLLNADLYAPSVKAKAPTLEERVEPPGEGTFSNLKLSPELERDVEFWKHVYTESSNLIIFNKKTFEIYLEEPIQKTNFSITKAQRQEIQRKIHRIEQEQTRHGKASKNDIRFAIGKADILAVNYEKLSPMLPHMRRSQEYRGVDSQMISQTIVESLFNPNAASRFNRRVGYAIGIVQMVRGTASLYMKCSNEVDERLDPIREVEGATMFLKALYARFGSAELSTTAYHVGPGGIDRAVVFAREHTPDADDETLLAYIVRNFPSQPSKIRGAYGPESSQYVQAVVGAMRGFDESGYQRKEELVFDEVQLRYAKGNLAVPKLLKDLQISPEELSALNPAILYLRKGERELMKKVLWGLKNKTISANLPESYRLRLPPGTGRAFIEKYQDILSPETSLKEYRRGLPISLKQIATPADLEYQRLIEKRRRDGYLAVSLEDLERVRELYNRELENPRTEEMINWLNLGLKGIEYDIANRTREIRHGFDESIRQYAELVRNSSVPVPKPILTTPNYRP